MFLFKKITLIIMILTLIALSPAGAKDMDDNMIKIKINDDVFDVKLENNSATQELLKVLEKSNVTVNATDYGNFEKVGNLGFTLPTNDENINTSPGDIVLYQGNQISLFYDSHSWSYTKIGKIQNADSNQLKDILGAGDVVLELSLK
ncbi:cyclophilin-like fold protein [Methanobrevibacter sp.]|uniref:cyclophilin-like fold protein n=1 Tax=Methanobrevibacter sp. TaxID=66852 RepID=UPI0038698E90